jgi:hypothetical protein
MTDSSFRNSLRFVITAVLSAGLISSLTLAQTNPKKKITVPPPPPKPAVRTAAPAVNHAPAVNRPGTAPSTGTSHIGSTPSANHPITTANHTSNGSIHTNTGREVGHPGKVSSTPRLSGPIHSLAPSGSQTRVTPSGSALRTRPNGSVSDVHNAKLGMDVHHNLGGGRTVTVVRPDHSVIVAQRGRPGFVQHPYAYKGHDYAVRTYVYRGHSYNRYYSHYEYRGVSMNVYAPGVYYHPAFYGWAYNPWAAPVTFGWGWGAAPWYGQYGYYFQPYPTYPSAAFWLTDYMISQDLQASYAAHQAAGEADGTPPSAPPAAADQQPDQAAQAAPPVMTPEVKQAIADEVKSQIALENSEAKQTTADQPVDPASSGIARLLSDGRPHTFVAGGHLDVTDDAGKECVVSDGDTLQLRQPPPQDSTVAKLVVMSSKGLPECDISLTVQVTLADLQEMQNHMRDTIDKGMAELEAKQGTNGLPPAPASAQGAAAPAAYAAIAPPPDPNAATEIQEQSEQANAAEKDVSAEAATQAPGTSSVQLPPPVALPPHGPAIN